MIQSDIQTLKAANRRIAVSGPTGSGKTTFSISASQFAAPTIIQPKRVSVSDVWVIQGDEEGIVGARDAGFDMPYVSNMTQCADWQTYQNTLAADLKDMHAKLKSGEVKIIVIDLGYPDRLINAFVDPSVQKDWKLVALEGGKLYRALSGLAGVTIIANYQLKAASSPGETAQAVDASNAKSIGGERSTFAANLQKGVYDHWRENATMIFAREVKRTKGKTGETELEFKTHTQSGPKFEAKSRFRSVIKAIEPTASLRDIMVRSYGDAV